MEWFYRDDCFLISLGIQQKKSSAPDAGKTDSGVITANSLTVFAAIDFIRKDTKIKKQSRHYISSAIKPSVG
jgi:hypothetical protein